MITAGLFKGLYRHHTDESVVSRSVICHPPEPAQGNTLPLRASSHDHPVLEVQTHASEVSTVPTLQGLYSVAFRWLQCALEGAAVCPQKPTGVNVNLRRLQCAL